jgi:hypothetical protein
VGLHWRGQWRLYVAGISLIDMYAGIQEVEKDKAVADRQAFWDALLVSGKIVSRLDPNVFRGWRRY